MYVNFKVGPHIAGELENSQQGVHIPDMNLCNAEKDGKCEN